MKVSLRVVLVLAVAAVRLLLSSPRSQGQSIPVAQVMNRVASKAKIDRTSTAVVLANPDKKLGELRSARAALKVTPNVSADQEQLKNSIGASRMAAWAFIVNAESAYPRPYTTEAIDQTRTVASAIDDTMDRIDAIHVAMATRDSLYPGGFDKAPSVVQQAVNDLIGALEKVRCSYTVNTSRGKTPDSYDYRFWLPTMGRSCSTDAIEHFFSVASTTTSANKIQYLYNAQQSTSQLNGDLLTATFPGFQAVLSGTATSGTGQSGSIQGSSSTPNSTTATTDSVSTAVAKIQAGGDFNVRFPAPIFYSSAGSFALYGLTSPNLGFNISGFSGQNTITESTEYTVNLPFEVYSQLYSFEKDSNGNPAAAFFFDARPGLDIISPAMAAKIGLTGSRAFYLGQESAGIEFSNGIRLSFQYIQGPKQIYQTTTSSGTTSTTTTKIGGFHLAVSFSPQTSSQKVKAN